MVPESERPSSAWGSLGPAPAAEELLPVAFPLDLPLRPAFDAHRVKGPCARFFGSARSPAAKKSGALLEILRLDEELSKGRMGQIVGESFQRQSRRSS